MSKTDCLINTAELNYLNREHSYPLTSVGKAKAGARFIDLLRRKIFAWFVQPMLLPYLQTEAEFHGNLVRFLNELCRDVDLRDWRTDDEYRSSLMTCEKQSQDRLTELGAMLKAAIGQLQLRQEQDTVRLTTVESVARGLERIIAQLEKPEKTTVQPIDPAREKSAEPAADYRYLLLENRFRGAEEEVKKRLTIYPPLFERAVLPVLEIGAGRGELQELFRESGISCYGLEVDRAMAQNCRSKSLDVRLEDAFEHLESLPDGKLGGVIAVQVIEHFPAVQLDRLFRLCKRKNKKRRQSGFRND